MINEVRKIWIWNVNQKVDVDDLVAKGCIETGDKLQKLGDFSSFKTREDFCDAVKTQYGRNKYDRDALACWRIMKEVSVGDIVVLCKKENNNHNLYGWGIISSICEYPKEGTFRIKRKIDWHEQLLQVPVAADKLTDNVFFKDTNEEQSAQVMSVLGLKKEIAMDNVYKDYIDLFTANYNLILNGAPGTGKTYLAKKIAELMRQEKNKKISAVEVMQCLSPDLLLQSSKGRAEYKVVKIENDSVYLSGATIKDEGYAIPFDDIKMAYEKQLWKGGQKNGTDSYSAALAKYIYEQLPTVEVNLSDSKTVSCNYKMVQFHPSYDYTDFVEGLRPVKDDKGNIGFERKDGVFKEFCKEALANLEQNYVFIIDEINRGEISKIFGELFFSIDPGYRGERGKVQTQYQNLVEDGDVFKDGFFVPENVYIIGTMNDIDRSVESMDFAMRRRFAWHEVTAEESAKNMKIEGELLERMNRLNQVIGETEGLGTSYHVGGAMFLKVQDGEMTVESLWNLNLKSLMKEYLRGLPDADDTLMKMEDAYFLKGTENMGEATGDNEE